MVPSLLFIETRQAALQDQKAALDELFNHYAKGHFRRGRNLAREIFRDAVQDKKALEILANERGSKNIDLIAEGSLGLIRTFTVVRHRQDVARTLILAAIDQPEIATGDVDPAEAWEHAQALKAKIDECDEAIVEQVRNIRMTLDYLAVVQPEKHARYKTELVKACTAIPDEVTPINGVSLFLGQDLGQSLDHTEANIALAYQQAAESILDTLRTSFAYVGAITFYSVNGAERNWAQLQPQLDKQIEMAGKYLGYAGRQIKTAKETGAAWTSAPAVH